MCRLAEKPRFLSPARVLVAAAIGPVFVVYIGAFFWASFDDSGRGVLTVVAVGYCVVLLTIFGPTAALVSRHVVRYTAPGSLSILAVFASHAFVVVGSLLTDSRRPLLAYPAMGLLTFMGLSRSVEPDEG